MAENKTKPTGASVEKFIQSVKNPTMRADSLVLLEMMQAVTKQEPKMWGASLVGFGQYRYKSERSACEGDWFRAGFSPRSTALSIYILAGFEGNEDLMTKLGKHKTGVGCLYVKKLSDVHLPTLKKLIQRSVKVMKERYPE